MADKRLRLIVEAVTSQAQQKLRSFANSIKQFGDQASVSLEKPVEASKDVTEHMGMMAKAGSLFLVDMGLRYGNLAVQSVVAAEQLAASNLSIEHSFEGVALRYGLESDKIIAAIKGASKNTIDEYAAMAAASKAMREGVATDVDEFEKLMKIAYVRGRETGEGTAKAWARIVEGVGGASPWLLRGLNIIIDTNDVLEDHARLLGIDADKLNEVQEQDAIRNEVLRQGASDLDKWNEMGLEGIDVFDQYTVTMAEFRQELTEKTLPSVISVTAELTKLPAILDQLGYMTGVYLEGTRVGLGELGNLIREGNWAAIIQGDAKALGEAAMKAYAVQDAARKMNAEWGQMYQVSAQARKGLIEVAGTIDDTTEDLEEQQKALEKAAGVWSNYLSDVVEKNWQFARRVADAQWSATQAAENAAFRLYEIERDASQSIEDLLAEFYLRDKFELLDHQRDMRRLTEDHLDAMADLEWEHQRDKRQLLEGAPWWVRQALSKEFAERERIRKSGDKEALAKYDKYLLQRIRQIDPAYAKELKKLEERYKHEEKIEEREARKKRRRDEEDFRADQNEQLEQMRLRLSQLERELGDQREAWQFSNDQRLENEKRSMDNLLTDHDHAMDLLRTQTEQKLAEITPIWEHYGYEWAMALIKGLQSGMPYTPAPSGDPFEGFVNPFATAQEGMDYVPTTMPVIVHRGESILSPGEAAQWRAGDHNEIHMHFSGGYTPYQVQRIADAVDERLGRKIGQRSR